jgi:hypothetical protein
VRTQPFSFAPIAALLLAACGPPSSVAEGVKLDGGWVGTYECGADSKRLSTTMAESDKGAVGGEAFLDYQLVLLGTPYLFTARAKLVDTKRNSEGVTGTVDVLDNGTSQLADFRLELTTNDDVDVLDGSLTKLDNDGAPTGDPCAAHLARTSSGG